MCKIFSHNLIKNCTLQVSSEGSGAEKYFLTNTNQDTPWCSSDISETTITMSFAEQTSISGIIPKKHNISAGETFFFESSNDGFLSAPLMSLPINPAFEYFEVAWQYKDYRLRMEKSTGDRIQIGEIYLPQQTIEIPYFNWGYTLIKNVIRHQHKTSSGKIYRKKRAVSYGYEVEFTELSDVQVDLLLEITEDDYCCVLPYREGKFYYGTFDFGKFIHEGVDCWKVNAIFTEN